MSVGEIFSAVLWLATLSPVAEDPRMLTSTLCLAQTMYHEARGEPEAGQYRVAQVVMHRVADPRWPDSACAVVYQERQFAWTRHRPQIEEAEQFRQMLPKAAVIYLETTFEDYDPGDHPVLYFYNPDEANPSWARRLHRVERIGNHVFLTDKK